MRHEVTFISCGLQCSAWLYLPDDPTEGEKAPAIVMAHGFSCVKEQWLDRFARSFAHSGFVTLLFDYRYFGGSEGEPRGQLFPHEQMEDYRNAVTWLSAHAAVDPERIGVWGTSFSGGLVFQISALDRRIKAAVAQTPSVLNAENLRALDPARFDRFTGFLAQERIERQKTGLVTCMKVVDAQEASCVLSGMESYEAFMSVRESAPTWQNRITVESMEKIREFDPIGNIQRISPTPLLIIAAEHDAIIPLQLLTRAFESAREPKEMLLLPCRHYDVYSVEPWCSRSVAAAAAWFTKYL